jgi:excinuclease ABC subunit C
MDKLAGWRRPIDKLPNGCGVYLFKNQNGYVYIGKAKDIKKRVLQHLSAAPRDEREKKIFLLSQSLDFIVTGNEYEALVLERQLISHHKPLLNIALKHAPGMPFLVLTEDEFPTVEKRRGEEIRGEKIFGPFFSLREAGRIKRLVHRMFGLRTCEVLPPEGKLCTDYQLGLCSGVCAGKISKEDYLLSVRAAEAFLSGEIGKVEEQLQRSIEDCIRRREFERCAALRDTLLSLKKLFERQRVLAITPPEADVWFYSDGGVALFQIRGGKLLQKLSFEGSELKETLLEHYRKNEPPSVVFVPPSVGKVEGFPRIEFVLPPKLKELVELNGTFEEEEEIKQLFERVLRVPYPKRVEGFDISHFSGDATVGSCVVWEKGKMNRRCYRRYRIKTVEGIDDYASLREVLSRRAKRLKEGKYPMPDIWLIDGGKGQLAAALEVKSSFKLPIFVVSLAKREEILFTEDGRKIPLRDYPPLYRIFGLIRDEAHRFALSYNRRLRERKILKGEY